MGGGSVELGSFGSGRDADWGTGSAEDAIFGSLFAKDAISGFLFTEDTIFRGPPTQDTISGGLFTELFLAERHTHIVVIARRFFLHEKPDT